MKVTEYVERVEYPTLEELAKAEPAVMTDEAPSLAYILLWLTNMTVLFAKELMEIKSRMKHYQ